MAKGFGPVYKSPVARSTPFDNATNGFTADTVQAAIEEIGASASPGFSWGRSGNSAAGTWLQNDSVPSNLAGRVVTFASAQIKKIFSATEDLNTYTLDIYEHEGNSINLTFLTTVTVTASRSGDSGTISIPVTSGRQLAIQIATGSAKNIVVGIILAGSV
jgi:hypothetical protein